MQHVTILGFKKVLGTSITIPMEMLNAADLIKRIEGKPYTKLDMEIASPEGKNITLTAGLEIVCKKKIQQIENTDLVIIPALWGNPKGVVQQYPALITWLQEQHRKETLICAVGTGSYFLAEAGLLDNKVATTHWYYFDQFASLYPNIHLQRDRFITKAGTIYCAGSVNSVRDVMLYFIENFYNPDVANQVSKHFTHEIKRSYTSNFLKYAPQDYHDNENIIVIQEWLHLRYSSEINLEIIAHNFDISVRSLNRNFKKAVGKSPMQYLQQIRIDNAKELLKTSNISIAEVAYNVGYPDCSYFSAVFKKQISLSPKDYRRLVRKKLFTVDT
jgi:transcriptional regulator GlxA family with amidase domain